MKSHAREVPGGLSSRDIGEQAVFLKLGEGTYIQVDQVETVEVIDGGNVRIRTFRGGDPIELSGAEAQALLRWLEKNSTDVTVEGVGSVGVYA